MSRYDTHDLEIITARRIARWDGKDMTDLFVTNDAEIVVAQSMRDRCDTVAVSDGHTITLRNCRERQPWSVKCLAAGRPQLMAFHPERHDLYFTSSLQNAIHCFSVRDSELKDLICPLPGEPVALCVSTRYILAVCTNSRRLCVQPVSSFQEPISDAALPSDAGLVSAAFHPQHPGSFLLAFADGILSIHKAGLLKRGPVAVVQLTSTSQTSDASLVAATFLYGAPLTVVSVTNQGHCQIHREYRGQGQLLRLWSVTATPTCLTVLRLPNEDGEHWITLGSANGEVETYSSRGYLIKRCVVDVEESKVLNVQ